MSFEANVARGKQLRADRAGMIARARELIDWLDANPSIPVGSVEIRYLVSADSDEESLAELGSIAKAAGLPIAESNYGRHHTIVKAEDDDPLRFISYQASYIQPDPWKPQYRKPALKADT